ncbi:MFS transporter [Aurantiacibacter suaedae]|uniref:MFS transporter n=1 Tax=Aurantiacibacter suaedae TaxID=2545755 RepID=UPI0010F97689|nr:MFS transporter [Aurantiacibacter suaedae]
MPAPRAPEADQARQSHRFLGLYALAVAGGSAAYTPFLTLLLPGRASAQFGVDAIEVLAYVAFTGAVVASLSNIGFGWASDRTRTRRSWIAGGLAGSCALLLALGSATSVPVLLVLIALWQIALNMMLAPLIAWAGDVVPDGQKGLLGGLLSFAPAIGALIGALVTIPGLAEHGTRLALNAGLVAAMVLPVLVVGRPTPMPHLLSPRDRAEPREEADQERTGNSGVRRMWFARLLVQVAESSLFAFLLLWLRRLDPAMTDNKAAMTFTAVLFVSVPVTMLAGRWSDAVGRPMLPLAVAAGGAATGLVLLSSASDATSAIACYVLFGIMAGVFLALHSSQTLRVLPRPATRGRDLGIFNLTNTIPSLVMPGLALSLVPLFGFRVLFIVLAGLVVIAALLLATLVRR